MWRAFAALPSPLISQLNLPDSAKLRIGRGTVHSVDYSPDGKRIAAASTIGVWIYDALFGKEIALLRGHTGWVNRNQLDRIFAGRQDAHQRKRG